MKNYRIYGGTLLLCVGIFLPLSSVHATQCMFTRTLELEMVGEDVRCLQQFLNEQGFTIAESGVGSKGRETNQYKEKTKEAVKKWQKAVGISPATGNFGPLSKSKYEAGFVTAPSSTPTPAPVTTPSTVTQTTTTVSNSERQAKEELRKGIEMVENFEEYIDDAEDDGLNIDDEEKALRKAQVYMFDAIRAFLDGQYAEIYEHVTDIKKAFAKYIEEVDENAHKIKAKEAINKAKDMLEKAEDAIDESDASWDDIRKAKSLFNKAENDFGNARDKYSDEKYEAVIDFLKNIEDYVDDILKLVD